MTFARTLPTTVLSVAVLGACLLAAPQAGAASTPSVSIALSGPTVNGVPFKNIAGTETTLTVSGKIKGTLPTGAKVRLGVKRYRGSLTFAKGVLKVKGGHVSTPVKSAVGGSVGYQLVAVSAQGRTIARSKMKTVEWLAPPTNLNVSLYGEGAEIELPSGKLVGCRGKEAGADTCLLEKGGLNGNVTYYMMGGPSIFGTPPGSTIKVYFNNALICEAHGPSGSCQNRTEVRTPPVAVNGSIQVPIVGEYISPAGAVSKVTAIVTLYA